MKEKFILCDLCHYEKKDGSEVFYIIIYSNLTQNSEKVFISKDDYIYLSSNKVDINAFLERYYNTYKKTFAIKFKR